MRNENILPCACCGKKPRLLERITQWYCECDGDCRGRIVCGPENDESGEKWNTMVRRMRGATLESRPATAYPERMRRARVQIAELKTALTDRDERLNNALLQMAELREKMAEIDAEFSATAELRDAIGDAWNKFQEAAQKLYHATVTPEPAGMTWTQLNAIAKVGDRAVCGGFRDGWFIERTGDGPHDFRANCSEAIGCGFGWTSQTDWRIIERADA